MFMIKMEIKENWFSVGEGKVKKHNVWPRDIFVCVNRWYHGQMSCSVSTALFVDF